jgi:hypothetical protein
MGSCERTLIVVRVMSSSFANDNSERYRKCAAEVRALAVEMTNRKSKMLILELAKDYDWLAKWVEERAGSLPYAKQPTTKKEPLWRSAPGQNCDMTVSLRHFRSPRNSRFSLA